MIKESKHESVSSEVSISNSNETGVENNNANNNPHKSVSGGSTTDAESESETTTEMVSDGFDGIPDIAELEEVTSFDPSRALSEGMPSTTLTEDIASLPEVQPDDASAEDVCGNDDRVQITNTTAIPYRWICQLIIRFPNGVSSRGTGWFIGPKTVMTAGHCVYSRGNGGWARSIEVIPGMNGSIRPYGSQVGTTFRSVNAWVNNTDANFDYGAIILPNGDLGNRVGYFGFAALPDNGLQNLLLNNTGYAGDKPFGTTWFNAGRVTSVTARKIFYMVDTYGGHSGSPVWRYLNGQRHAIGIHAYGGCPNSATRIITEVYNNMLMWKNA